jgi:hypothetical protein
MHNWKKRILTSNFESESCCFADVDGDGIDELVAGDSWWRLDGSNEKYRFRNIEWAWLPAWPHNDREDPMPHLRFGGGPPLYRNSTYDFAVNNLSEAKGPDIISVGMHKDPIVWYQNRFASKTMWPKHLIAQGGVYEAVVLTDILHNERPSIVTVPKKPWVAWYEPKVDPYAQWDEHIVGYNGGDWHGLGAGDLNGDGHI